MHVKKVLIVGGGSSGWMTAAALMKQTNIEVTLIESPDISTIGVGESTIGHINEYMHFIGLKDEDWMKHCNATYKTSIKFINFRENPSEEKQVFHYPFGMFDFTDKPRGIMEWFIYAAKNPGVSPYNFAEFFHDSVIMTDAVKMTRNEDRKLRGFNFASDTAYHMDATLFGNYLRDHVCKPNGMTHILDDVISIEHDDAGIRAIHTKKSGTLTADLYIDCTGFRSLLLEQTLGVPFNSFHDVLMNDSAIATVIPYIDREKEMECVTSCTAIEAGWVWNIPLWNRIGTGYVYSSKFATQEEAEAQFRAHLKSKNMVIPDEARGEAAEFRHIKIKHGVHARAWEKNVVAIGLSNGFIEPLESTGLMLTHEGIMKMVHALKMRDGHITRFDRDMFNFAFYDQICGFKEFISEHYALSRRNDTPYWKHVTENVVYSKSMVDFIPENITGNQTIAINTFRHRQYDISNMNGILYIAAGMGYNPTYEARVDFLQERYKEQPEFWNDVYAQWLKHREEVLAYIDTLPSHEQFLRETIYS